MKKIILSVCIICYMFSGFSQEKSQKDNSVIEQRVGIDLGLGVNFFSGKNDDYTKVALDLGIVYELREKVLFGIDFSFSPKEKHEDTGGDGSRSTHVEWDGQATCIEAYVGYKAFNRTSFLAGLGTCFSSEYEVMKGYSNLTSYKRNSQTYLSPILGVIYELPMGYSGQWYLKYDMAIGGYNRHSLSVGLKF
jgi:hypothetical protein